MCLILCVHKVAVVILQQFYASSPWSFKQKHKKPARRAAHASHAPLHVSWRGRKKRFLVMMVFFFLPARRHSDPASRRGSHPCSQPAAGPSLNAAFPPLRRTGCLPAGGRGRPGRRCEGGGGGWQEWRCEIIQTDWEQKDTLHILQNPLRKRKSVLWMKKFSVSDTRTRILFYDKSTEHVEQPHVHRCWL